MIDAGSGVWACAIAWTLFHSLWQGLICWIVCIAARASTISAAARTAVANAALLGFVVLQVLTLGFLLYASTPFDGAVQVFRDYAGGQIAPFTGGSVTVLPLPPPTLFDVLADRLTPALPWVAGAWLLGAAVQFAIVGRDCLALRVAIRTALPLEAALADRFREFARRLGIRREVTFLRSSFVSLPATARFLRPVVLIPPAAALGLTPFELEAVVLHELGHVLRNDFTTTLLRTSLRWLYYFHPAVHAMCVGAINDSEQPPTTLPPTCSATAAPTPRCFTRSLVNRRGAGAWRSARAGGSLFWRTVRLTRVARRDLNVSSLSSLCGAAVAGAALLVAFVAIVASAAADRRAAAFVNARTLSQTVVTSLSHDAENPTIEPAFADAIADLRSDDGRVTAAHLDRLAIELTRGVRADPDRPLHPSTTALGGIERPTVVDGLRTLRLRSRAEPNRRRVRDDRTNHGRSDGPEPIRAGRPDLRQP